MICTDGRAPLTRIAELEGYRREPSSVFNPADTRAREHGQFGNEFARASLQLRRRDLASCTSCR